MPILTEKFVFRLKTLFFAKRFFLPVFQIRIFEVLSTLYAILEILMYDSKDRVFPKTEMIGLLLISVRCSIGFRNSHACQQILKWCSEMVIFTCIVWSYLKLRLGNWVIFFIEDMFLVEEVSHFSPDLFFETVALKTYNKKHFDEFQIQ